MNRNPVEKKINPDFKEVERVQDNLELYSSSCKRGAKLLFYLRFLFRKVLSLLFSSIIGKKVTFLGEKKKKVQKRNFNILKLLSNYRKFFLLSTLLPVLP